MTIQHKIRTDLRSAKKNTHIINRSRRRRYLDRLLLSCRTYRTQEEWKRTQEEIVCASGFGHRERRRRRREEANRLVSFWRKRKASGIKLVIMRPPGSQVRQRENLSELWWGHCCGGERVPRAFVCKCYCSFQLYWPLQMLPWTEQTVVFLLPEQMIWCWNAQKTPLWCIIIS